MCDSSRPPNATRIVATGRNLLRGGQTDCAVGNLNFIAVYICRWTNGDFSIVNAKTKAEAIALLDEWGNAEQALVSRMTDCLLDFRLTGDGEFELANVGEYTHRCIMETCYPELDKVMATAELDGTEEGHSAKGEKQIREAVELERTRLRGADLAPSNADTEIGRDIQRQTDAPGVLVNRIVREAASKRLKTKEGEGKKPN